MPMTPKGSPKLEQIESHFSLAGMSEEARSSLENYLRAAINGAPFYHDNWTEHGFAGLSEHVTKKFDPAIPRCGEDDCDLRVEVDARYSSASACTLRLTCSGACQAGGAGTRGTRRTAHDEARAAFEDHALTLKWPEE